MTQSSALILVAIGTGIYFAGLYMGRFIEEKKQTINTIIIMKKIDEEIQKKYDLKNVIKKIIKEKTKNMK